MNPKMHQQFQDAMSFASMPELVPAQYINAKFRDQSGNETLFPAEFLGSEHFCTAGPIPPFGSPKKEKNKFFGVTWVTWCSSDTWAPGEDALYHSSQSLGMVDDFWEAYPTTDGSATSWVPIERLCWILEPETLFDRVMRPRGQDGYQEQKKLTKDNPWWFDAPNGKPDVSSKDRKAYDHWLKLAKYYLESLELFAEMALDRSPLRLQVMMSI